MKKTQIKWIWRKARRLWTEGSIKSDTKKKREKQDGGALKWIGLLEDDERQTIYKKNTNCETQSTAAKERRQRNNLKRISFEMYLSGKSTFYIKLFFLLGHDWIFVLFLGTLF